MSKTTKVLIFLQACENAKNGSVTFYPTHPFPAFAAFAGYLSASSESEHIQPGTRLELPLWLARSISSQHRQIATVEIPKPYRSGHRQILDADAAVVDLHKICPYYYAVGTRLLAFGLPDSSDVARSMLQAFQTRLRRIMDASQNSLEATSVLFVETLDKSEQEIFASGQRGLSNFLQWETRQSDQLVSSGMVANLKKRKRIQMEEA